MTLVLKSNTTASNSISDKHGVISAYDWKLMLDFENQQYLTKSNGVESAKNAGDYIESKNTNPFVYKDDGVYQVLPNDSLRLSLNKAGSFFGLLEESSRTNYYSPSDAPVSKTINLPMGVSIGPYVVEVVGSGSVSISGASIYNASGASATESTPLVFMTNSPSSSAPIAVAVSGDVEYLSIHSGPYGANSYFQNTQIKTQASPWAYSGNVTRLKQGKLPEVANSSEFTVLLQFIDNDFINIPFSSTTYRAIIELVNGSKHISLIKRKTGSSNEEIAIRVFDTTETIRTLSGASKVSTIAISSGSNGLIFAVNGVVTQSSQILSGFTIADLLIGSSSQWLGSFNAKAQGLFTKFALYDRQLSTIELSEVSRSFL